MNKLIKICVVVASRANYARVKYLMLAIQNHPNMELQLIVGASTLLHRFGKAIDVICADGFTPLKSIFYIVEGETLATQAKSTGLGIVELTTAFEDLKPHAVVTVADRFETMATAIAASYLNIPLIHIQGGEISGNIDDKVRNSVSMLSDIHFPSTEKSKERLIKMGINPSMVYNFGCPAMDILKNENLLISNEIMKKYGGVGFDIDWTKPYILMVQHPVTTSYGEGYKQVNETLEALKYFKEIQKIVLWPNIDAGSDSVSKAIRVFRENNNNEPFHYYINFSPEDYARVLNNCICCVGNSSSFIREGSFLGVPAVIVGDRQIGREHGENVIFANYEKNIIIEKLLIQVNKQKYQRSFVFGNGDAGEKIANKISKLIKI